jgi:hypothetical protein
MSFGEAMVAPRGEFTYAEFNLGDITYNEGR